jgi:ligand-binding sensor domain-containing protein
MKELKATAIALLLPFFSLCQQFAFEHYSSNNGLSSNTAYYAMQDSKGFIWFGTEAGACRFDGINYQSFTMADISRL